jgi:FkbM family methyltransferase
MLELQRVKRRYRIRIPPVLYQKIVKHPASAEDWVNLLSFLNPEEKILLIDVGANEGQWAFDFMEVFPNTELVAFEPSEDAYRLLCKKMKSKNNVQLHNVALSAVQGERTLYVPRNHTLSSFESYNHLVNSYRKNLRTKKEHVLCKRLDSFTFNKSNNMTCLKIDVQGHEVPVLRGAEKLLETVDLCLCELSFAYEYEDLEPSFSFATKELLKHDLHPIIFQEYSRVLSNYAYERDVLFVKKNLLDKIWIDHPFAEKVFRVPEPRRSRAKSRSKLLRVLGKTGYRALKD